jgi:Putative phage tail protein
MATLIFSAIGTLIGGPLGGALGALAGRQVDGMILPRGSREGPRLAELAVTTSSYGTPIPRHFGRMRVAGSVIWATDLAEHKDKQGGKGKPSTTSYTYSASFAVALSSRPVGEIGRIWADGKLLRGVAGDLKVAGTLRLHQGHPDQPADSLIASAEASTLCPAFRGIAYVVFEDLQLAEFGNRIPALTFEIVADSAALTVADLLRDLIDDAAAETSLDTIAGLSCDGALADALSALDAVIPMDCNAAGNTLVIAADPLSTAARDLGEAALSGADDSFGQTTGFTASRAAPSERPLGVLRYYDVERDYQPGAQRATVRSEFGEARALELPASLTASAARTLVERAAHRADWARQTLAWRTARLDPDIGPGSVVTVPNRPGWWKVAQWEWRATGVEVLLERLARHAGPGLAADAGRPALPPDLLAAPTVLTAFELPWDGTGAGTSPIVYVAASSAGAGWSGAALFHQQADGALDSLGPAGRTRAVLGIAEGILAPASPHLLDRHTQLVVQLLAPDLVLAPASFEALAAGANRALVGAELIQFAAAEPLGAGRWQLSLLLRGRGGTESQVAAHLLGEQFILLDGSATAIDAQAAGLHADSRIAAIGLADETPVFTSIALPGNTLRPLAPVHGRASRAADGGLALHWTRRARGAWRWLDGVDAPLSEQAEAYSLEFGSPGHIAARWEVTSPSLTIDSASFAALQVEEPTGIFFVRQIGSFGLSGALSITP